MCEGTSGRNTALIAALVSELVCTVVCECVGVFRAKEQTTQWCLKTLRNEKCRFKAASCGCTVSIE